ncbi:hypothetical protein NDA11_002500 [Ustilago hordei]|nr:hypothetical protein NDA10_006391 [Ustilago hordei]KAJ1571195.1 hypothetical protein NDA12_002311 [Ustilago hordei]KAJ1571597.1 hypothetical protein NDA15_007406 [Ustilago hordei]KAJ1596025.1 hypothetical protein NDA11_002500 [Ustilago hordei]KAJ1596649.1 hypothetical protein NDA14_002763 [Ustilago hordei]
MLSIAKPSPSTSSISNERPAIASAPLADAIPIHAYAGRLLSINLPRLFTRPLPDSFPTSSSNSLKRVLASVLYRVQDLSDPLSSTDATTSTSTEQPTNLRKAELYAPMQTPPQLFGTRRLRSVMLEYICKSATELDQDMRRRLAGRLEEPELLVTAIKEYLKPHTSELAVVDRI